MPKQPQDHKRKIKPFTFTGADGEKYTLPPISDARDKISGADYEDAVLAGEIGMLAFMVRMLRTSGAGPEALEQLRALPQGEYMDIVQAWQQYGDGDGASLGE